MNYMTLGKTLYKAMAFGALLIAVYMISMPSVSAMAIYQTSNGPYATASSGEYYSYGNDGYSGNNSGNNWNTYGGSNSNCPNCSQYPNGIAPDSIPVVSTEPAMNVKKTSALIQGAAHVDSGTATVWFEWGTRVDKLDNTTRNIRIDNMSTGSSQMLTNLTPGTKYFYRIVAHNSTGTCKGLVRSFVTPGGSVIATAKASTNKSSANTSSNSNGVSTSSSTKSSASYTSGDIKGNLSASAANASGSTRTSGSCSAFVPCSVVGWLVLIALVFAIVVVVRKIQIQNEERKKRAEARQKLMTA